MIALETSISEAEELFMHFKLGQAGSGFTALINCIFAMDMPNRKRISLGYPELVDVVNRYNHEPGYWKDLVDRYNEAYQVDVNP